MYWDEATQEYGYVLTKIAGEPLPDLLRRRVLDPIGVSSVAWNRDATGKQLNWTGGLEISAADLARFGHLYLNRGAWEGKRLIDPAWVDEATRVQVPASVPSGHSGTDHREGSGVYGYHWWPNGIKPDGERKWPDAPVGTYAAQRLQEQPLLRHPGMEHGRRLARPRAHPQDHGSGMERVPEADGPSDRPREAVAVPRHGPADESERSCRMSNRQTVIAPGPGDRVRGAGIGGRPRGRTEVAIRGEAS